MYYSMSLSLSPELARKQQSCILIHCMAGISRSVTLTIAYLMKHFTMPMQAAYQYVKERRPAISPNLNFMGQLVEFETSSQQEGEGQGEGLQLVDYAPSSEQDEMSELMKVIGQFCYTYIHLLILCISHVVHLLIYMLYTSCTDADQLRDIQ